MAIKRELASLHDFIALIKDTRKPDSTENPQAEIERITSLRKSVVSAKPEERGLIVEVFRNLCVTDKGTADKVYCTLFPDRKPLVEFTVFTCLKRKKRTR